MRTIRLTEYQATTEELNERELAHVQSLGHVAVSPRRDGEFELRSGSTVGTVVFPDLHVLIRPKVGMPNIFFLLSHGAGITRWSAETFPYDTDDFFAAIAWAFEAEVRRATRFGLVRDYREHEDVLTTIRGRIDIGAQVRRRQGQPFPLECRFEEFDEDTLLNRVVKAALRRLLSLPGLDRSLATQLRHHLGLFAGVADLEVPASAVPELGFDRRNEAWESSARLAQLILRAGSVRDEVGAVSGIAFTVNMNVLFERFVERVVGEVARERGWQLVTQARRKLSESVILRPDLVIRNGDADMAVGDAKYKRLESDQWPHADLYQLLAYCVGLGLPSGLLIYGETQRPRREVVRRNGVVLEIVGVDLSRNHHQVLQATRSAALKLLQQAQHYATVFQRAA